MYYGIYIKMTVEPSTLFRTDIVPKNKYIMYTVQEEFEGTKGVIRRVFQKRVARTKFDICVFITITASIHLLVNY